MDETSLTAGQLDSHGLQSLSSLNSLIQWQRVPYDFQYHTTDFACNIVSQILCGKGECGSVGVQGEGECGSVGVQGFRVRVEL